MSFMELIESMSETVLYYFNIIQKNGPLTINDIIEHTGISRGRLMRIFKQLEEDELIISNGNVESTGGRRSILYDVDCNKYLFAGFSIGSVQCSIHIVNIKGQHIVSRTVPLGTELTLSDFLSKADYLIQDMLNEKDIKYNLLVGIGLGLAGSVNRQQGLLIKRYTDFLHPSWLNSPLISIFQSNFSLPVTTDSNIFGEALTQYYYGAGRDADRLLVVYCSMSIASAFVSKGQTFRELNVYDDALAHMTIDIDGRVCSSCGNYGCVTAYSSVSAILEDFKTQMKIGISSDIKKEPEDITITDITEAAERNDSLSKLIITKAAHVLGCGLASYIRLLNPDSIILGGILIDTSELYFSTVIETTRKRLGTYGTHHNIRFISKQASTSIPYSEAGAILFLENALNPGETLIPRFNSPQKMVAP